MRREKQKLRLHSQTILLAVLLACFSFPALAQERDDPQRDSQIWQSALISIKLRDDLKLLLNGALRIGRDDSAIVNKRAGIGLNKSFGKNFTGAVMYEYINSEPTPDRPSNEHRLYFELTPRKSLGFGLTVLDRNRLEWRDINDKVSWRYRNRLQFERPIGLGELKITPYIAEEAYYDTRFDTWNRNQLYIGARVPIVKHVTFDGFYAKQWDARTRPGFLNVIGAYWRLEF